MNRTITCPNCGHHGWSKDFDVRQSRRPEADRFWEKVTFIGVSGCLEWTAGLNGHGYGSFRREDGAVVAAHAWAWEDKYGPVPEGQCVLHRCDNRKCVYWGHLFLGTRGENNADRDRKGRTFRKLTDDAVAAILASGETQAVLAERHGVSQSHVSNIKNGNRR